MENAFGQVEESCPNIADKLTAHLEVWVQRFSHTEAPDIDPLDQAAIGGEI